MTNNDGYRPIDPDTPEGQRLKAFHDLTSDKIEAMAGKLWNNLSDWMREEYTRHIDGKFWQSIFEPRKISPPGGYQTPKVIPTGIASFFTNVGAKERMGLPILDIEITAHSILYEVLRYKVQTYFVADSFIRAVAATELPKDFTLHDLHWPMPGMVIGLPSKFMLEYTGRDICYVYAADLKAGDHEAPAMLRTVPATGTLKTITTPDKVGFMFYSWNNGRMHSYVNAYAKGDRVDEAIAKYAYTDFTFSTAEQNKDDERVTQLVSALLFKLLVVLNTRPALVESGGMARPRKVHPKTHEVTQTELWNPNIIGAKYRVIRHTPGTGTHASPDWHWRRGHITHQRIGSHKSPDFVSIATLPRREDGEVDWLQVPEQTRTNFWKCHKRLWLEPTLINFDEEEEKAKEKKP